jgi:hypothetical protein
MGVPGVSGRVDEPRRVYALLCYLLEGTLYILVSALGCDWLFDDFGDCPFFLFVEFLILN